jgi:hypothetical protein
MGRCGWTRPRKSIRAGSVATALQGKNSRHEGRTQGWTWQGGAIVRSAKGGGGDGHDSDIGFSAMMKIMAQGRAQWINDKMKAKKGLCSWWLTIGSRPGKVQKGSDGAEGGRGVVESMVTMTWSWTACDHARGRPSLGQCCGRDERGCGHGKEARGRGRSTTCLHGDDPACPCLRGRWRGRGSSGVHGSTERRP